MDTTTSAHTDSVWPWESREAAARDAVQHMSGALVAAVDGSPPAAAALRFAARLAAVSGEPLHVVHVWNMFSAPRPDTADGHTASEQERQAHADTQLRDLVDGALAGTPATTPQLHAVHADVAEYLRELSGSAAHIVIGNHSGNGIVSRLLGSTTTDLIQHAQCPVTVVPAASRG